MGLACCSTETHVSVGFAMVSSTESSVDPRLLQSVFGIWHRNESFRPNSPATSSPSTIFQYAWTECRDRLGRFRMTHPASLFGDRGERFSVNHVEIFLERLAVEGSLAELGRAGTSNAKRRESSREASLVSEPYHRPHGRLGVMGRAVRVRVTRARDFGRALTCCAPRQAAPGATPGSGC